MFGVGRRRPAAREIRAGRAPAPRRGAPAGGRRRDERRTSSRVRQPTAGPRSRRRNAHCSRPGRRRRPTRARIRRSPRPGSRTRTDPGTRRGWRRARPGRRRTGRRRAGRRTRRREPDAPCHVHLASLTGWPPASVSEVSQATEVGASATTRETLGSRTPTSSAASAPNDVPRMPTRGATAANSSR